MVVATLKEFGTGQVTLPKEWRDKFDTHHYLARETNQGLLLEPILYDEEGIEVVEDSKGLHFPKGIPAGLLARQLEQAYAEIHQVPSKTAQRPSGKGSRGRSKN